MDYLECERRGEDRIPVTVDDLSGDQGIGSLCQDDEPSRSEIEERLKLLDEVWPRGDVPTEELPRELGRFKLLGELGRGGFGVVFLAEDELLGRRVAVKVPRVEVLTGSESWRRLLREVRAASRLDHANLVPTYEAGAVGPVGFIGAAYIPGPSLDQWLRSDPRPVEPRWTARLVESLARAIDHVHDQNILHRDLKPANILLHAPGLSLDPTNPSTWAGVAADSWIPRICDFGLAKLHEMDDEETRSRMVCGSPPYMAPEQADSRRDEIGPATDVYGLGAILYELLTGRPPFGGTSNLETLRRVVSEQPVPPRRRRP
jgi:serine/threonine protein kinase